jgi:hypothetical protein
MANNAVNILLVTGFGLAVLYAVVSFTQPSGSATSGAFAAATGVGGALFAGVLAVLALFGLWQSKAYKKM